MCPLTNIPHCVNQINVNATLKRISNTWEMTSAQGWHTPQKMTSKTPSMFTNKPQDAILMTGCNIFSAWLPQPLQPWSHFVSHFLNEIKVWLHDQNLWAAAEAENCTAVSWQAWHEQKTWTPGFECEFMWVRARSPATYSQRLTKRASAYIKVPPTCAVSKSPRGAAQKHSDSPCCSRGPCRSQPLTALIYPPENKISKPMHIPASFEYKN